MRRTLRTLRRQLVVALTTALLPLPAVMTAAHAATPTVPWGNSRFAPGTNMPWIERGCDFGCSRSGVAANEPEVDDELDEIARSGARVVRWYLLGSGAWQIQHASGTNAPTELIPAVFRDVDRAIELAERYDLYYDFVVLPDAGATPSTWYTDPTQRAQLARVLRPLFRRYRDDDHIVAWELFDEPERAIDAGAVDLESMRATVLLLARTANRSAPTAVAIGPRSIADIDTWRGLGLDFVAPHWFSNMSNGPRCATCTTEDALNDGHSGDALRVVIGAVNAPSRAVGLTRLRALRSRGYAGAWTWAAERAAHPSLPAPTEASYPAMRDFAYPLESWIGPLGRPLNPCYGPQARTLLCPDMVMYPPDDMWTQSIHGNTYLRQRNRIVSQGQGPLELHGVRAGRLTMSAVQRIHRRGGGGGSIPVRTGAKLYFKAIPGQFRYWKFRDAAHFELWRNDARGRPRMLVRIGPKQIYCLRDLRKVLPRGPRHPVFPGCSQDPGKREVTLGTSVGWADVYPSTYHEQWIDVTGLRGCFSMVHIADPLNHLYESNERNNRAVTVIRLPYTGGARGCPGAGRQPYFPPGEGSY